MNIANIVLSSISLVLEVFIKYIWITLPLCLELGLWVKGKDPMTVRLIKKIIKLLKKNKND